MVLAISVSFYNRWGDDAEYQYLYGYIQYFSAGLLVFEIFRWDVTRFFSNKFMEKNIFNILFVISMLYMIITLPAVHNYIFGRWYHIWSSYIPFTVSLLVLLVFLYSSYADILFGNNFTKYNGSISYSIYLLHTIVQHTIANKTDLIRTSPLLFLAFVITITFIISSITHKYIEMPLQNFVRRKGDFNKIQSPQKAGTQTKLT